MNLSYWEKKSWFSNVDFCVVGSGIVGLNCALHLKSKYPQSKVLVLEKGRLPQGASTKNAGFACFGSVSEILDDLKHSSPESVYNLVRQRVEGLNLLIQTLGKQNIGYQQHGGYELFFDKDKALYEECISKLTWINELVQPVFKTDIYTLKEHPFHFKGIQNNCIYNSFEAQIDTGKMMLALLKKVYKNGITVLNSTSVKSFSEDANTINVQANGIDFKTRHLFIATNAFSSNLLGVDITPARNQVVITSPIKDLNIRGTFHLDRGYYYFRNVDNRILLGGGRHMDSEVETTAEFGLTDKIQKHLEELLRTKLLPEQRFGIDMKWSGILGTGQVKEPIVRSVSERVHCGIRLGGMGVAIGSSIGRQLANLV